MPHEIPNLDPTPPNNDEVEKQRAYYKRIFEERGIKTLPDEYLEILKERYETRLGKEFLAHDVLGMRDNFDEAIGYRDKDTEIVQDAIRFFFKYEMSLERALTAVNALCGEFELPEEVRGKLRSEASQYFDEAQEAEAALGKIDHDELALKERLLQENGGEAFDPERFLKYEKAGEYGKLEIFLRSLTEDNANHPFFVERLGYRDAHVIPPAFLEQQYASWARSNGLEEIANYFQKKANLLIELRGRTKLQDQGHSAMNVNLPLEWGLFEKALRLAESNIAACNMVRGSDAPENIRRKAERLRATFIALESDEGSELERLIRDDEASK